MSQSLGTGSLILNTDTSRLTAGLTTAATRIGSFSSSVGRQFGPSGLVASSIGKLARPVIGAVGGIVSGAAGLVSKLFANMGKIGFAAAFAFGAVTAALFHTREALGQVVGAGRFADNSPLSSSQLADSRAGLRAVDSMLITIQATWQMISVAVAPVLTRVSNFVQLLAERLQPVIPKIASGFSAFADIAMAVFTVVIDGVVSALKWIGNLIDGFAGFSQGATSTRDIVLNVFEKLAVAGSYVWDTIRAGVGVVLITLGSFISALSYVTDAFSELVSLAKKLPDELKPSWVDGFADGVANTSKLIEGTGRQLREWGTTAVNSFGKGKEAVQGFFNDIRNGKNVPEVKLKFRPIDYNPVAAMLKNSKEAYSVETRFRMQDFLKPKEDIPKQQLQVEKQQLKAIEKVGDKLDRWSPLALEAW